MTDFPDELKILQFVSNVIQLEPNKKYLLIIRGVVMDHDEQDRLTTALRSLGISCLSLSLPEEADVSVVEVLESSET